MSDTGLSVKEFQRIIKDEVKRIAEENHLLLDSSVERGYAFQRWIAEIIVAREPGYETDAADACLRSNDLKADLVFIDPARTHILICQCKYQGLEKSVDESEVNDFFQRHKHFCNREWVLQYGSAAAKDALADYGELMASGYSATYYFFSTGTASPRVHDLATASTKNFAELGQPIVCELFDFGRLKEYYLQSRSLELPCPSEVVLHISKGRYIQKESPYQTIVAVVKGNELRNIYLRWKESLYAYNIRGYLGNRGINNAIYETAQERPEDFYYFNNGISAICTEIEIRQHSELYAKNFQVINGAQTITSLAKATANSEIDVLLRLTRASSVKTDKGFNRDLIQYNNSQNAVRISDFRSNDPIQIWLEQTFPKLKNVDVLPPLLYLRKRTVGRRGGGVAIRLEDLSKIRYAFLLEPTLVFDSPKSLWSLKEDDGVYEQTFGVEGELQAEWSEDTLAETLFAIALYLRIDSETKELASKSPEMRFLRRLRFHALSLAGYFWRDYKKNAAPRYWLHDNSRFDEFFSIFWPICKQVLIDAFSTAEEQKMTTFAFVRSGEWWEKMKKRFKRNVEAGV
jgi:hypothetical protein